MTLVGRPTVALLAALLCGLPAVALGAGPLSVAIPQRSLWPEMVNSPSDFDRASRAEILVFAHALAETESRNVGDLKALLSSEEADVASIERVRRQLWQRLAENYKIAGAHCRPLEAFCPENAAAGNLHRAIEMIENKAIPERYRAWLDDATEFHRTYLNELLRLAALFPRTSSEIDVFNDNEVQGWALRDRTFLLTFDDGPTSGLPQADADPRNTDLTVEALRTLRINAAFFVLGEPFQQRLQRSSAGNMQVLYSGMCVGSHGWLHVSHAKWRQWQDSIGDSLGLIDETLPQSRIAAFRPPYGERRADSGPYFLRHGLKVVLWNIDSQDWNDALTASDVEQRVMSLMLLWRRGIILFHDTHAIGRTIVSRLMPLSARAGVIWADCHQAFAGGNGRSPASAATGR